MTRHLLLVWFLALLCSDVCAKKDFKTESTRKTPAKDRTPSPVNPPTRAPSPALTFPNLNCPLLKGKACLKDPANDRPFCAAYRGNGAAVFVHFTVVARMVELLGPVHGQSGGSSGAIASFIVESIQMNPLVRICGNRCCTLEEQTVRISFLLKSTEVIANFLFLVPIPVGLLDWLGYGLYTYPKEITDLVRTIGTDDFSDALVNLAVALADPTSDLVKLVNPEFVKLLKNDLFTNQAALMPHILDIVDVVTNEFSSRADTDPLVTVRVFLVNYRKTIAKVDIVGSFYAGLEPVNIQQFAYLIEQCALPDVVLGNEWDEIERHIMDNGQTCLNLFRQIYFDFVNTRDETHPRRMEDFVGGVVPTFVSTGVLTGDTFDYWKQATIDYVKHPSLANFSSPDFGDFRMGNFGDEVSLNRAEVNLPKLYPNDLKAQRFLPLGQDTWEEVMLATSCEPTLAKGIIQDEEKKWASVGGWNDELPTQLLRASGCDNVISINGAGGPYPFPLEISIGLGASIEDRQRLFAFDEFSTPKNSSFLLSLTAQDATVCVPWKRFGLADVQGPLRVSYTSDFMSTDTCLQNLGAIPPRDGNVGEANFGCLPLT